MGELIRIVVCFHSKPNYNYVLHCCGARCLFVLVFVVVGGGGVVIVVVVVVVFVLLLLLFFATAADDGDVLALVVKYILIMFEFP